MEITPPSIRRYFILFSRGEDWIYTNIHKDKFDNMQIKCNSFRYSGKYRSDGRLFLGSFVLIYPVHRT